MNWGNWCRNLQNDQLIRLRLNWTLKFYSIRDLSSSWWFTTTCYVCACATPPSSWRHIQNSLRDIPRRCPRFSLPGPIFIFLFYKIYVGRHPCFWVKVTPIKRALLWPVGYLFYKSDRDWPPRLDSEAGKLLMCWLAFFSDWVLRYDCCFCLKYGRNNYRLIKNLKGESWN